MFLCWQNLKRERNDAFISFIEYEKALDRVQCCKLIEKLGDINTDGKVVLKIKKPVSSFSSSSCFLPTPKSVSFSTSLVYPMSRLSSHPFCGLLCFSFLLAICLWQSSLFYPPPFCLPSCLCLYVQSLIFSILQDFVTFSFLSLLNKVFPDILLTIFIYVVSKSLLVFEMSGLVSAIYVTIGLTIVL